MIKHIVFWKIKSSFSAVEKVEIMSKVKELLLQLPARINVIKVFEVGFNVEGAPDGNSDICLYSEFNSLADFYLYKEHPEHCKVGEYIKSVVEGRAAIDYAV